MQAPVSLEAFNNVPVVIMEIQMIFQVKYKLNQHNMWQNIDYHKH